MRLTLRGQTFNLKFEKELEQGGRIEAMYDAHEEWGSAFSTNAKSYRWDKLGDPVLHIDLRNWADMLLIAPLSAHTLAKIANGYCDDLLSCVCRAWNFNDPHSLKSDDAVSMKLMILAPAMNTAMWKHPLTKIQLDTISKFSDSNHNDTLKNSDEEVLDPGQIIIVPPKEKKLACGEIGVGALADVDVIIKIVMDSFFNTLNS